MRALIRLAREDETGAVADAENALDFVGEAGDLQQLSFALPTSAYIFALVSETGRARELLRAFLEPFQKGRTMGFAATTLPVATIAALHVGLEAELLSALDAHPETLWSNVVRAEIAGDFASAAELLQRAGAKTDEAEARLHAGTGDQLEQALEFYRSVGATRFIDEGEALLAAAP
jgi:hypothetical protein